ncbi:MAG: bifunctional serine/threonine-protein kinase/ABC transporter substrate-binding protein [Cyanobacteria bacterium P01_A01_bin.84]
MSHCLNPNCTYPYDPMNDGRRFCRNCGSNLLLNNRYRVVKHLGKGGFSKTFEVVEKDKRYVLKVLNLYHFHNQKVKDKVISLFKREALVLQSLDHPGIPKVDIGGYFEVAYPESNEPLYCLVMEKIDGFNLQQWLDRSQHEIISVEKAYEWLKQLLEILEKVHQQGYFHRDIKPANIMIRPNGQLVLIDFGAVRDLAQTYLQHEEANNGTQIGSPGYAPLEQIHHGKAVAQSDFFALARTFVHLLTKVHPLEIPKTQDNKKLIWHNRFKKNKENPSILYKLRWYNFCILLDSMMEAYWQKRPKTIKSILRRLEKNFVLFLIPYRIILLIILLLSGLGSSYWYLTGVKGCAKIPIRSFPINDEISCGEEILIKQLSSTEKLQGIEAIKRDDYRYASSFLELAWNKQRNPETLIYLNNANIEAKKIKSYTIAVVAPISNNADSINSSLEILKGIAQAQDEFNRANFSKGLGIKVLIANDNNNPIKAKKIAQKLVNKQDVLAVIGHFTSDTTIEAIDIYQKNKLLLISPTATSEDLGKVCQDLDADKCFFRRVVGSDRVTAKKISRYLINNTSHRKAAVFFNKNSNYSKSIEAEFKLDFTTNGGQIVKEFDLFNSGFNADYAIQSVKQSSADVLVLLPNSDGLISNKIFQLIAATENHYPILGGDGLYHSNILKIVRKNTQGLIVAIPWQYNSSPNMAFTQQAQKMWGGKQSRDNNMTDITWRTAMTYDAAKTLLNALEKLPISTSREDVVKALNHPTFQANGATGAITFNKEGVRKEQNIDLFRVVRGENNKLKFVLLSE